MKNGDIVVVKWADTTHVLIVEEETERQLKGSWWKFGIKTLMCMFTNLGKRLNLIEDRTMNLNMPTTSVIKNRRKNKVLTWVRKGRKIEYYSYGSWSEETHERVIMLLQRGGTKMEEFRLAGGVFENFYGKDCPIASKTIVDVRLNSGATETNAPADTWNWLVKGQPTSVKSYRILRPAEDEVINVCVRL